MRVIAGQWRGLKLYTGGVQEVRPLTDRIKESVFGILSDRIMDGLVLDLFAGSGSFGIEALSRGAKRVIFCEKKTVIAEILRKNLARTGCEPDRYQILRTDVFALLPIFWKQRKTFDLIFVDPPFRTPMGAKCLLSLSEYDVLARKGILIYRHHQKEAVPEVVGIFHLFRSKKYGDSTVKFYQKADDHADSNLSRHF